MAQVPFEATIIAPGKANKPLASMPNLNRHPEARGRYNTRVKFEVGAESVRRGLRSASFATSAEVPILQAPEAFPTLSFRLDLTIYRRYNPRT
jgi:hypothetical protein